MTPADRFADDEAEIRVARQVLPPEGLPRGNRLKAKLPGFGRWRAAGFIAGREVERWTADPTGWYLPAGRRRLGETSAVCSYPRLLTRSPWGCPDVVAVTDRRDGIGNRKERRAVDRLHGGEVIFHVRGQLVPHRRELRLYALCRSGRGAWLASIAPFEELFFDDNLLRGLTVREALKRLEARYAAGCRPLVALAP